MLKYFLILLALIAFAFESVEVQDELDLDRDWCNDKVSTHRCVKKRKEGECSTKWVAKNCARTCGKCPKQELGPNQRCKDKNPNCDKWLKKNISHKCRKNFFAHMCMKSCKHC